ncbi:MAG: hypothetical protein H7Z42_22000 [Roseiflexaceae bacterium]|nr:hypothetical protein [Roseiflexaceae bacterium]
MAIYHDPVFAPIDLDHTLERLGGGNETEVYRSDDGRWVIKLKAQLGGSAAQAAQVAHDMRAAADEFAACLGPRASLSSAYLIARDQQGHAQVLVIQPFLERAIPLAAIDYDALSREQRAEIACQLHEIIRRALVFYRHTRSMPDLYGRKSSSSAERQRNASLLRVPQRVWSFLVERNLLRSQNLMLSPNGDIVLVDYDIVRRGRLYRAVYFGVRWMLFWRDNMLVWAMREGGTVPGKAG